MGYLGNKGNMDAVPHTEPVCFHEHPC
jgi:hypothetical protein